MGRWLIEPGADLNALNGERRGAGLSAPGSTSLPQRSLEQRHLSRLGLLAPLRSVPITSRTAGAPPSVCQEYQWSADKGRRRCRIRRLLLTSWSLQSRLTLLTALFSAPANLKSEVDLKWFKVRSLVKVRDGLASLQTRFSKLCNVYQILCF